MFLKSLFFACVVILGMVGASNWPLSRNYRQKTSGYFDLSVFIIIGATEDRSKFGNEVLRCMVSHKKYCIPFNKRLSEIEGLQTVDSLATFVDRLSTLNPSVPMSQVGMNLITPREMTLSFIKRGYDLGIRNFFCQRSAADDAMEVITSFVLLQYVFATEYYILLAELHLPILTSLYFYQSTVPRGNLHAGCCHASWLCDRRAEQG